MGWGKWVAAFLDCCDCQRLIGDAGWVLGWWCFSEVGGYVEILHCGAGYRCGGTRGQRFLEKSSAKTST